MIDESQVLVTSNTGDEVNPPIVVAGGKQGPKGDTGKQGSQANSFRQFLVLGIFVLLTALALGYLVQKQQDYAEAQCQVRRAAVIHQNRTWQDLTLIEQIPISSSDPKAQERIRMRIKIYADAQVPIPDCGA